jgi:subfamily B ATP-binding cassette protein MsbA
MNHARRLVRIILLNWDRLLLGILATALVSAGDGISIGIIAKITDILTVCQVKLKDGVPMAYHFVLKAGDWTWFERLMTGRREIVIGILWLALAGIIGNLVKAVFTYGKIYTYNSLVFKSITRIRNLLYERLVRLPTAFYDQRKTGDLMARITQDVETLRANMLQMVVIIFDCVYALFFIVILFVLSWQLTLIAILFFPLTAFMARKFARPLRKANTAVVENVSRLVVFLQESLQNIRVIKVFTRESDEIEKFRSLSKENYSASMRSSRLSSYQRPVNDMLSVIGFLAVILLLAFQTLFQGMTLSSVVAYVACMNMAYRPLKNVASFNDSLQKTLASAARVFELSDLPDETALVKSGALKTRIKGRVEFRKVSFGYHPGRPVLKDLSFTVPQGKTIAIVGPSGSGKTTLVSLLPLFYHDFTGTIRIDNHDIREYDHQILRSRIAIVPQDIGLFSGTIRENISFGRPDASDAEIERAAIDANAHDFIVKLKNGYESETGERGLKLSGGEKQRIAIARALLKDPAILILDEATSSLDTESERLVQSALDRLMIGRTTFVIAHRLSTIRNADRILVLSHGRIVESGTHDSLLKKNKGLYRKLRGTQHQV